jgi:hypothetical protein
MKNILIILLTLPAFLFSQNEVSLPLSKIVEINQAVRNCLDDYEQQSKVSNRNEDEFFMLFTDDEKMIDDVIPSVNYGKKINSLDWVDLMKGVKIYNFDTDILEFESYNPYSLDSGYVIAKVKKTVKTAIWSDKVKPNFNIVIGEGDNKISQRVNYKTEEVFRFKLIYSLKSLDFIYCTINSIDKVNDLSSISVYVPYVKPPLGGVKRLIKSVLADSLIILSKKSNSFSGDNIKYFIGDQNVSLEDYKLDGYRKPKINIIDNSAIADFIYTEKLEVNVLYSFLLSDKSSIFEVGAGIQPDLIEYNENSNIAVYSDLYKLNDKITLGLKFQRLSSSTNIQVDSYEFISQLENPITNFTSNYTRINQFTNFNENIDINQDLLLLNVKYNYKDIITLFGGFNLWTNNKVTSQRSGSAKYSGIFDVFDIEIDEPIDYEINGSQNTLELGYKQWDINEDLISEQKIASVFEVGIIYSLPIPNSPIDVDLHGLYKHNTESLFSNIKKQISADINEFNSFAEFGEELSFKQRINVGLSVGYKF